MYLSAALKQAGHTTYLCCVDKEDVYECIDTFEPTYVAASLVTGTHQELLRITKDIRLRYRIRVIVGGPHATFFSQEIPEETADYIVVGHGEKAVVDIVEQKVDHRIVQYPLNDLDRLPHPDRELIYRHSEFRDNPMKNIITCRDCPYSCSYCYNHTWKRMFKSQSGFLQRRRVEDVVSESQELKTKYRAEQLLFIDDNFLIDQKWVESFCDTYLQEVGLPFLCSFSVNLLNVKLLSKLKKAGLTMVNFALESADPMVQKKILQRGHVNNEQIIEAISLLREFGVKTRMQNMIGLPVENALKDALNTLSFNKENRVDDSWVSIFQPYPNTRLSKYCQTHGFIESNGNLCADSFFDSSRLRIDNTEKIRRLQKWWYFIIHYNLSDNDVDQILKIDFNDTIGDALLNLRYAFSRNYLYSLGKKDESLGHNWEGIMSRHCGNPKLDLAKPLIQRYRLSNGLADILMDMDIPEKFIITERGGQ